MYKVIGSDNVEYGPVNEQTLREWIKAGRVNSQSKIKEEGAAEWKPLSTRAEFTDLLSAEAGLPPALEGALSPPGKLSGLAIASLVLAILGWVTFGLTALFGLVLGIVALVKINKSGGTLRGTGLALAGTIVSAVLVLILPILAALMLPALAQAKGRAQSIVCMNNMKQLALGGMMYASDNKDRFPSADNWCDVIGKYVPNAKTFQCPLGAPNQKCHYAYNAKLSGVDTKAVSSPSQTVLIFEVEGGWNLSGGPEIAIRRHQNSIGLVFADGHCEIARESRLQRVRWEP